MLKQPSLKNLWDSSICRVFLKGWCNFLALRLGRKFATPEGLGNIMPAGMPRVRSKFAWCIRPLSPLAQQHQSHEGHDSAQIPRMMMMCAKIPKEKSHVIFKQMQNWLVHIWALRNGEYTVYIYIILIEGGTVVVQQERLKHPASEEKQLIYSYPWNIGWLMIVIIVYSNTTIAKCLYNLLYLPNWLVEFPGLVYFFI